MFLKLYLEIGKKINMLWNKELEIYFKNYINIWNGGLGPPFLFSYIISLNKNKSYV
jgi:hypothetical protein